MWLLSNEESWKLERFYEDMGLTMPLLLDNQNVQHQYEQQMAFPTGAYPQDWIIGVDGTIQYYNNRYEYDAMIEVIERELAKTE